MKKPMKKDDRPAPGATHDATAELDRTAAVIPMRKRRGGWPARTYKPGERVPMSFRVTPEFKEKLDRAALESGRSLAQEIEIQLELSRRQQHIILRNGMLLGISMALRPMDRKVEDPLLAAFVGCPVISCDELGAARNRLVEALTAVETGDSSQAVFEKIEETVHNYRTALESAAAVESGHRRKEQRLRPARQRRGDKPPPTAEAS
jgi:hypothetical protein